MGFPDQEDAAEDNPREENDPLRVSKREGRGPKGLDAEDPIWAEQACEDAPPTEGAALSTDGEGPRTTAELAKRELPESFWETPTAPWR